MDLPCAEPSAWVTSPIPPRYTLGGGQSHGPFLQLRKLRARKTGSVLRVSGCRPRAFVFGMSPRPPGPEPWAVLTLASLGLFTKGQVGDTITLEQGRWTEARAAS